MGYLVPPVITTAGPSSVNQASGSSTASQFTMHKPSALGFSFRVKLPTVISTVTVVPVVNVTSFARVVNIWDARGFIAVAGTIPAGSSSATLPPVTLSPSQEYIVGVDTNGDIYGTLNNTNTTDPVFSWGINKQAEHNGAFPYFSTTGGNADPGIRNLVDGFNPSRLPKIQFVASTTTSSAATIWPEPVVKTIPNAFTIQLPSDLLPSNLKEWDLQVAKSATNGTFDPWIDVATVTAPQIVYTHSNQATNQAKPFYIYRYRLRNANYQESDWSEPAYAGPVSSLGVADAAASGGGIPDTAGSVDGTNIANGSILPAHITTIAGNNFVFPGTVKSNSGGFIFPDATTQTTAASGDKFAANIGAITANVAYTINHAMANTDVVAQFREISSGAQVDIAYTVVDGNNISITLPNSVAANTYRVVVMA